MLLEKARLLAFWTVTLLETFSLPKLLIVMEELRLEVATFWTVKLAES